MRHRKTGRKLGMDTPARKAMFRNMVTSLLRHGQIQTTLPRAKELRRFADKVISYGKRAPSAEGLEGEAAQNATARRVHLIRQARLWVNDADVLHKLFNEIGPGYASRPGGYTRVVKAGTRAGDNADMAIVQLVEGA